MHTIRKTWWLPLVVVVAAAGLYAAVSRTPEADADDALPPVHKTTAEAASAMRDLAQGAPRPQAGALADGVVTQQEYRAAVDATITCLRKGASGDRGIEVSGPTLSPDGFTFTYEYSVGTGPEDASAEVERSCRATHLSRIERGYHLGKLADGAFVASAEAQLSTCLDRADVPSHAGPVRERVASELSRTGTDPEVANEIARCLRSVPSINDLN